MRLATILCAVVSTLTAACSRPTNQTSPTDLQREITRTLERYTAAVRTANSDSLRVLWADTSDVSFVTPMSRLGSWQETRAFWDGFVKTAYRSRALRFQHLHTGGSGDVAWATFDIEFDGVLADGKPLAFRGWETQIYRRVAADWLIVQIHYSIPFAAPRSTTPQGR